MLSLCGRDHRQVQPLLFGTVNGNLITRIRVTHHAGGRVVVEQIYAIPEHGGSEDDGEDSATVAIQSSCHSVANSKKRLPKAWLLNYRF